MALWCRHLKTAAVEHGTIPKRLTLVLPFYDNHAFLQTQLRRWAAWPQSASEHVEVIIVDDGSPMPLSITAPPVRLRQFRIDVDVRWNWLAARNIGAHHAAGEWLLLTDMDHVVPNDTLWSVIFSQHDPKVVYAFSRREHTGQIVNPHSASFLMTKALFWKIGGYDEALSGFYGTDGEYRRRVAARARMQILPDYLERHEYVDDSSTSRYKRKQPEDARVRQLIAARTKTWFPKTLSFPYHEVHQEASCLVH